MANSFGEIGFYISHALFLECLCSHRIGIFGGLVS